MSSSPVLGCHPIPMRGLLTSRGSLSRRCDQSWRKRKKDVEQPYWEWEPEGCYLESVNATKFCKVMENRKGILLVGESIVEAPRGMLS